MPALPALSAIERALAHQPLRVADAAAALLAAEGPHEQRDRVVECFRAHLRFVAAVALAVRLQRGPGPGGDDTELRELLEKVAELLGKRPKARVLLEASTESEWVARCLEELGHEVVVADPNFASMYATRSRRIKTGKRDARTLAEANRLGAYRPAHRISNEQRQVRAQVATREVLVRTRTRLTNQVSARKDSVHCR
jgi:transposase